MEFPFQTSPALSPARTRPIPVTSMCADFLRGLKSRILTREKYSSFPDLIFLFVCFVGAEEAKEEVEVEEDAAPTGQPRRLSDAERRARPRSLRKRTTLTRTD